MRSEPPTLIVADWSTVMLNVSSVTQANNQWRKPLTLQSRLDDIEWVHHKGGHDASGEACTCLYDGLVEGVI